MDIFKSLRKKIQWLKKKHTAWKEAIADQRQMRDFSRELHAIYINEARKYYEPIIKKMLGEQNENKLRDNGT